MRFLIRLLSAGIALLGLLLLALTLDSYQQQQPNPTLWFPATLGVLLVGVALGALLVEDARD